MIDSTCRVLRRPIFVLGCHKSGTTLLCCLLDGQPELFVLPLETHLLQYSGYPMNYPLRRDLSGRPSRRKQIEHMVRNVSRTNRGGHGYGAGSLDGQMNVEAFRQALQDRQWSDDAQFIQAAISAAHVGLTGRPLPADIRVVEKSVENASQAPALHKMMPDSSFIHIVRNPYATVVSIRKAMSGHGYPELRRVLFSIRNSFEALQRNAAAISNYKILRYEDLVQDTPAVIRSVADFLGISFCESMLTPTKMGKLWQGNSTSDRQFSGVAQGPLENWKKSILPLEIALVNRILANMLERFNYEKLPDPKGGLYARLADEGPWRYLQNRCLLSKSNRP